jgi:hypothetical protein
MQLVGGHQRVQDGRQSFTMAPLFPLSVRDPGMLGREDVRQLLKKKHYGQAFRLGWH